MTIVAARWYQGHWTSISLMKMNRSIDARFIRLRNAALYLGMDKNRFNVDVRPYVTEIPIGVQGIAFDRLELDAWADQYKSRNGRPGRLQGERLWDATERLD